VQHSLAETVPYCMCVGAGQSGYTYLNDVWVHASCSKMSRMAWEAYMGVPRPDTYYALPPRGITKSTFGIGLDTIEHFTYLCEVDGCMALAYGRSENTVRHQLANHICPALPRKDLHVTSAGTAFRKMWDELDDTIWDYKELEAAPQTGGETYVWLEEISQLKGKARGLSLAIAFAGAPYWRDHVDVLREANKRWKMHKKLIKWEPTPGYEVYPVTSPMWLPQKETQTLKSATKPATKPGLKPAKKAAQKATAPATKQFTQVEIDLIKNSVLAGMSVADLAKMYGVAESRIRGIIDPKPLGLPGGLF
jgi:hypothetical protein